MRFTLRQTSRHPVTYITDIDFVEGSVLIINYFDRVQLFLRQEVEAEAIELHVIFRKTEHIQSNQEAKVSH